METMFWIDMVGWAASAAVLATFCMNTMMPLRVLAIISNVLFCAYGAVAHIFPVLILHSILLPVNVVRLVQIGGWFTACRRRKIPSCRSQPASIHVGHPSGQPFESA